MNSKNNSFFPYIVLFSGLGLSACSAYYSVVGISDLFSFAKISVAVMLIFLEVSKLVMVSFLYRYWGKCNSLLKMYSSIAVVILMLITAVGMGGVLLSAYQSSSIENKAIDSRLSIVESNKSYIESKIESSQKRISNLTQIISIQENRLTDILSNPMVVKNSTDLKDVQKQSNDIISKNTSDIESERIKIENYQKEIKEKNDELIKFKNEANKNKDIVTFKFVANIFNKDTDSIVKYFIMLLMSVFDPLAICLLLAYNTIILTDVSSGEKPTSTTDEQPSDGLKSKLRKIARKPFDFYIKKTKGKNNDDDSRRTTGT